MKPLLRSSDVAKKANLTRQQVHRLARLGKIPGTRLIGKQYRFDGTDYGFAKWLKDRKRAENDRKIVMPKGTLPAFLAKGPPFKMDRLIESVGFPHAIRFYADWLKTSLATVGGV